MGGGRDMLQKGFWTETIIIYYMMRIFTDQVLIFVKQIVYFTTLFFPKMVREANTGTWVYLL